MHDVIVVGGSVAGATAAAFLAHEGWDVLLLDRAEFPRPKACGEGIQPYGVRVLDRLGVSLPRARPTRGLRFRVGARVRDVAFPGGPGLAVRRIELDPALRACARARGAGVRRAQVLGIEPGHVRTDRGVFPARVVIGADGVGSAFHRALGVRRKTMGRRLGLSTHLRGFQAAPDRVEIALLDGGEVYLAPVGPQETLAAFLIDPDRWRRSQGPLPRSIPDVSRLLQRLWPDRTRRLQVEHEPLASSPLSTRVDRVAGPGWLLVGDAAGRLDPVSGQGLALALAGAERAAAVVSAHLREGAPLETYETAWRIMRRPAAAVTAVLLGLTRRPAWADVALRLPGIAERLMIAAAEGPSRLRPKANPS